MLTHTFRKRIEGKTNNNDNNNKTKTKNIKLMKPNQKEEIKKYIYYIPCSANK